MHRYWQSNLQCMIISINVKAMLSALSFKELFTNHYNYVVILAIIVQWMPAQGQTAGLCFGRLFRKLPHVPHVYYMCDTHVLHV